MTGRAQLERWECPHCHHQIDVLGALEVSHRCPNRQNRRIFFHRPPVEVAE